MTNKILLIGRANVGKTTIKKVIFEGNDPRELMAHPLEPTRGVTPSVYAWMDLELSIFDTSGQELLSLLEDENERAKAFENADIVIYMFDYQCWLSQSRFILEEIQKIFKILSDNYPTTKLILFFHKIDLINPKVKDNFKKLKRQIHDLLGLRVELPIYFTSLTPGLIYMLYDAFLEILYSLSKEVDAIKKILDEEMKNIEKAICIITNQQNSVIVQSMTSEFDTIFIDETYKKLAELVEFSKTTKLIGESFRLVKSSSKILSVTIDNLFNLNPNLKNIFIFSEILSKDKMAAIMQKIVLTLSKQTL